MPLGRTGVAILVLTALIIYVWIIWDTNRTAKKLGCSTKQAKK